VNNTTINTPTRDYRTGNVQIKGNVNYANSCATCSYANVASIPTYYLIVYGGDIFIDPNVNKLDGIYIALPDTDGNGGNIYTCSNGVSGGGKPNPNQIATQCDNQPLRVYGSLIAKKINLIRSFKSLVDSKAYECPGVLTDAVKPCTLGSTAAEAVISGPETWLNSAYNDGSGYDVITSLPPIL